MMLSFTIAAMRPKIEAGLRERAVSGFPRPGDYSSTEDVKRQTIRFRGPVWQRVLAEAKNGIVERDLHLWWRSRTKNRERLGTVRGFGIEPVTISRYSDAICTIHLASGSYSCAADGSLAVTRIDPEEAFAHAFARADGFDTFTDFVRFFVPRAGDRFCGALIRW